MRQTRAGTRIIVQRPLMPWALALLYGLSACRASIAAPLEIMVEDAAAPWSQADGSGYANDVVKSAFRAAGVDVLLRVVPYARCKQMVASGNVAGCFSMSWDRATTGKVDFSAKPLFSVRAEYVYNASKPLAAKNESELAAGTKVGTVIGYEYPESTNRLRERGIVFEEAQSEVTNLKKLAAGRIDAAIINVDAAKKVDFVINRAGVGGKVLPVFRSAAFGSYIGFSRMHRQGEWACEKFNAGYALITNSGDLGRIKERWGLAPEMEVR